MATLDQVLDQMALADMPPLPPGHPILDGAVHRYGPKKKCWYRLNEFRARNGKVVIAGAFGRWSGTDNGRVSVKADFAGIEPDEFRRLQATQATLQAREREKREGRARFASHRAEAQWKAARARPEPNEKGELHPYLARKRLQWEKRLRLADDGTLYVPMVRLEVAEAQLADPDYKGPRRLAGLQKITPSGEKLFNRGMDPVGAVAMFGPRPKDGDLLLVGEGLATVLSVHQGLERAYTSFVAFTAGNLAPAARILRALYPASPVVFLADDDAYLEAQLNRRLRSEWGVHELFTVDQVERELASEKFGRVTVGASLHEDARGTPVLTAGIRRGPPEATVLRTLVLSNAGRTKAHEAAAEVRNASVVWPRFAARVLSAEPDGPRLTDFNDLHIAEGIERVVEQAGDEIRRVRDAVELSRAIAAGVAPGGEAAKAGEAGGGGAEGGGGGGGGGGDGTDWRLHWSLLRRFTLVERSGQAWDAERGYLWRIEHMRLSFGSKPVGMWLASSRRRAVDLSQVVFDPSGVEDPKTTVNLFRGLETRPREGSCDKLIELLRYLCGEQEATNAPVSDWVLKWCAYQVKHVGAKMKTAIVMYGPEGTGKNLFWSAILDIFGRYGALIGQSELEDKHNTWLSAKLFIVANEVVTRAEMSHHVGRLKNMITEDRVYINPKMVDQRYERNHVNLAFLSNEFQPLKISPGDRRYMVIRTPAALEEGFYREVAAELRAGGAAAFMHYLLELDIGDFGEHSKPIVTEAKLNLIEIGMQSAQLFWTEIKEGLLELPYGPCLSDDLYRAYTIWCARRGHKMPQAQHLFTPAFMSMNGVRRREPRVPDPDRIAELGLAEEKLRKRRVFYMGSRPEGIDERAWVVDGIAKFRAALRNFEAEGGGQFGNGQAQADRSRQSAF